MIQRLIHWFSFRRTQKRVERENKQQITHIKFYTYILYVYIQFNWNLNVWVRDTNKECFYCIKNICHKIYIRYKNCVVFEWISVLNSLSSCAGPMRWIIIQVIFSWSTVCEKIIICREFNVKLKYDKIENYIEKKNTLEIPKQNK